MTHLHQGIQRLILVLLLFSSLSIINAQTHLTLKEIDTAKEVKRKYNTIIYDFNRAQPGIIYQHNNSRIKQISKPWFGKRAMLTVKINPYLYDVLISSRQVVDGGVSDSAAMRAFINALDTLRTKKNIEETRKSAEKQSVPTASNKVEDALEASGVAPAIAAKVGDIANSMKISTIEIANVEANKNTDLKIFKEELRHAREIYDLQKAKQEEYNNLRKKFFTELDTFLAKAKLQQDLLEDCDYLISVVLTDHVDDNKIIDKIKSYCLYKNLGAYDSVSIRLNYWMRTYQGQMNAAFDKLEISYMELSEMANRIRSESDFYRVADSISFNKARNTREEFAGSGPTNIAMGVCMMLNNIISGTSFLHPHHSVLIERDTLIYKIITRPSMRYNSLINRYGIKSYFIDSFDYKIPVKGTFKLNFSIGMAFLYNSLRSTSYFLSPSPANLPDDSSLVQIREGKKTNRFQPAIGAFAHAYLKMGGYITPAITIGVSTNPTDFSDASYFLGLSTIFGHQNRFIFTAGMCGSKVEYLKGKYQLNKDYYKRDFLNINDTDLSEKTFRAGLFFAVSYNLSADR